jgi:hypothetical protein
MEEHRPAGEKKKQPSVRPSGSESQGPRSYNVYIISSCKQVKWFLQIRSPESLDKGYLSPVYAEFRVKFPFTRSVEMK